MRDFYLVGAGLIGSAALPPPLDVGAAALTSIAMVNAAEQIDQGEAQMNQAAAAHQASQAPPAPPAAPPPPPPVDSGPIESGPNMSIEPNMSLNGGMGASGETVVYVPNEVGGGEYQGYGDASSY